MISVRGTRRGDHGLYAEPGRRPNNGPCISRIAYAVEQYDPLHGSERARRLPANPRNAQYARTGFQRGYGAQCPLGHDIRPIRRNSKPLRKPLLRRFGHKQRAQLGPGGEGRFHGAGAFDDGLSVPVAIFSVRQRADLLQATLGQGIHAQGGAARIKRCMRFSAQDGYRLGYKYIIYNA